MDNVHQSEQNLTLHQSVGTLPNLPLFSFVFQK